MVFIHASESKAKVSDHTWSIWMISIYDKFQQRFDQIKVDFFHVQSCQRPQHRFAAAWAPQIPDCLFFDNVQ